MLRPLSPHPDFPCRVLSALSVKAERIAAGRLALHYRLAGVTADLALPPDRGGRADELWRHTCLEAFVRLPGGDAYRELNLSPGGEWAAYRFEGYRTGMADAEIAAPVVRRARPEPAVLEYTAVWSVDLPADAPWQVAVTAVVEATDGSVSYWSLRHPPGRPDFHHADGFVLELPPISPP